MSTNIDKYQGSEELLEKLVKVNRVAKVVKEEVQLKSDRLSS